MTSKSLKKLLSDHRARGPGDRARRAARAREGRRARGAAQAARRVVADLFRRLFRQALQRAETDRSHDGEEPDAGVDHPPHVGRGRAGRRRRRPLPRGGGAPVIVGGEGPADLPAGAGQREGHAADGRRHALHHLARQRLGARRARRPRALALLLAHQGQHADRQPRRRHVERLPLHGDARQLPDLARREDRQGALEQGPRGLQSAVPLDVRADHRRQPRDGRHGQRSRFARLHAVVRSADRRAAVAVLYRADEAGRSGHRYVGQPRSREVRRRASVAAGRLRSGDAPLHLRHRQSDSRVHAGPRRWRQPVHLRADRRQCRHRQDGLGTSRRRRTTCTTGIPRRRRS